MVDKNFCMSSYLMFRYIIDDGIDFYPDVRHRAYALPSKSDRILVHDERDIDKNLQTQFATLKGKKLGLLLSGGMDSGILASYMRGANAYTFRFKVGGGGAAEDELRRAEYYADKCGLKLHYVDIDWSVVEKNIDVLMKHKGAPTHSIEPQIYEAALCAKADGVEMMVQGDAADYVFGGLDGLHAKDWTYDEFKKRFTYLNPTRVLKEPVDMDFAFEKYRRGESGIDFIALMHEYTDIESCASYENALSAAGMPYVDPYEVLKMDAPLDLERIRAGESKYLIRALFAMKYPEIPVPSKVPMPRPVDAYFADWNGPARGEFLKNLDVAKFSGNQKWQLWCLERFLNVNDAAR